MSAQEKAALRARLLKKRRDLRGTERKVLDGLLAEGLREFKPLWDGRPVFSYVSTLKEADTRRLFEELWRRRLPAAAPKVIGRDMEFFWVRGWEDFEEGFRGILEPRPGCLLAETGESIPVILTPGAAFDRRGFRIGYGGGFYDRYLKRSPRRLALGLAYGFQMEEEIFKEPFDEPVDWLLTERGLIFCKGEREGAQAGPGRLEKR